MTAPVELVAPPGFKRAYERAARDPASPPVLGDLLALIGYEASPEAIASWPLQKRVEAEVHAVNVHCRAADNIIRRHPAPAWMPEPWAGHVGGAEAFWGPSGTVLP